MAHRNEYLKELIRALCLEMKALLTEFTMCRDWHLDANIHHRTCGGSLRRQPA